MNSFQLENEEIIAKANNGIGFVNLSIFNKSIEKLGKWYIPNKEHREQFYSDRFVRIPFMTVVLTLVQVAKNIKYFKLIIILFSFK